MVDFSCGGVSESASPCKEIADAKAKDVMLSLHLKATMMKAPSR